MPKYTKTELALEIERLRRELRERERERESKFELVIGSFVEYFCR